MLSNLCKSCTSFLVRRQICFYSINQRFLATISFQKNAYRTVSLKFLKTDHKSCAQISIFSKLRSNNKADFDVNTSVQKDVVVFKLVKGSKEHKVLIAFSVFQFVFWTYLANFAYTNLKDVPVTNLDKNLPFWRRINFGEKKYKYGFTAFSSILAVSILVATAMFVSRSVHCLVLLKGGTRLTFVTRSLFGFEKRFTTDVANVSCFGHRKVSKVYLPIKVKDRVLHYVLDMNGEFTNPELFDYTAGIHRKI